MYIVKTGLIKPSVLTVFLIAAVVASCGCTGPADSRSPAAPGNVHPAVATEPPASIVPANGTGTRTIVDMAGRSVIVPANISRLGLLSGPIAQLPYILGVRDRVVATTENLKNSPLLVEMDPRITTLPSSRVAGNINIEEISRVRPEVFVCTELDGEVISRQLSVPVVYVASREAGGFNDTREQVRFFGQLVSREDRAEAYCRFLDTGLRLAANRTAAIPSGERKKVFFGYGPSHLSTFTGRNFMTERADAAGCINVASGNAGSDTANGKIVPPQAEVPLEQVIAWDPDLIVIDTGNASDILQDPRWQTIRAVRTNHVVAEPAGIFRWSRPNPESAALYPLWLAKTAYPEKFTDIRMEDPIRSFYQEFFDYTLTSRQLAGILHTPDGGDGAGGP